jgi:hypothetical protein
MLPYLKLFAPLSFLEVERFIYRRVTELLGKAAAAPEDFGYYHSRLGLVLALAGNFSEARQEFTVVASAPKRPDDNCTERSSTHFLEGSLSEVVQTASACAPRQHGPSTDPVLEKYFSLLRLGKQKEAEEYLNQVTLSFVGEEKEQLLLLEIQGRLQGHNTNPESRAIQRRFELFDGLPSEAVGNSDPKAPAQTENGRQALTKQIQVRSSRDRANSAHSGFAHQEIHPRQAQQQHGSLKRHGTVV